MINSGNTSKPALEPAGSAPEGLNIKKSKSTPRLPAERFCFESPGSGSSSQSISSDNPRMRTIKFHRPLPSMSKSSARISSVARLPKAGHASTTDKIPEFEVDVLLPGWMAWDGPKGPWEKEKSMEKAISERSQKLVDTCGIKQLRSHLSTHHQPKVARKLPAHLPSPPENILESQGPGLAPVLLPPQSPQLDL